MIDHAVVLADRRPRRIALEEEVHVVPPVESGADVRTGQDLCEGAQFVLRVQHPFGGTLKLALMRWAISGCQ